MAGGQHERIRASLLASYGEAGAQYRDQQAKPAWKLDERDRFLRRLQQENCRSLLELGAGTGPRGGRARTMMAASGPCAGTR